MIVITPAMVYALIAVPFPPAFGMGKDAWLGYYGSFFGGLFGGIATMYAVFSTINHNKDSEEESKRLSIIPYINVKIGFEEKKKGATYYLEFSNVGLGTAIELNIGFEIEAIVSIIKKQCTNFVNRETLPINEIIRNRFSNFEVKPNNTVEVFTIEYWDVIHKHKYRQNVELIYIHSGVHVNSISKQELIEVYKEDNNNRII